MKSACQLCCVAVCCVRACGCGVLFSLSVGLSRVWCLCELSIQQNLVDAALIKPNPYCTYLYLWPRNEAKPELFTPARLRQGVWGRAWTYEVNAGSRSQQPNRKRNLSFEHGVKRWVCVTTVERNHTHSHSSSAAAQHTRAHIDFGSSQRITTRCCMQARSVTRTCSMSQVMPPCRPLLQYKRDQAEPITLVATAIPQEYTYAGCRSCCQQATQMNAHFVA